MRGIRAALISGLILVAIAGAAFGVDSAVTASSSPAGSPPMPGKWNLIFDSEFNGDRLNLDVWNPHDDWPHQNGVTDHVTNVAVSHGDAILTLASPESGAAIATRFFRLRVGDYAQARIRFAGRGRVVYNWPAWWTSGPNWPEGGENDIAEGFGALTVNYHSPSVNRSSGPIAGDWAGGFHTYGLYRGRFNSRVYWDGKLVRVYRTDDDGAPQTLLLTLGTRNRIETGPESEMIVDYVRVWAPD